LNLVPHEIGNPARSVESPAPVGKRERVLSDDEIATLWEYLEGDEGQTSTSIRLALKVALTTGQRIGEVLAARVENIDLETGVWLIPDNKAGRPHSLPLSALATEVMTEALEHAKDGWLFCSPRGGRHIHPDSVPTAIERDRDIIGIEKLFSAHDLRRTASTGMGNLGVSRHIISAILNHADGTVDGIYDRSDRMAEMRAALELWSERLRRITGQETAVVPFTKAG
jgi:integrase